MNFLFGQAYRDKWFGVGLLATAVLAAAMFLLLSTPIYRAQVVTLINEDDLMQRGLSSFGGELSSLAFLADLGGSRGDKRSEALAFLRSRDLTQEFIVEHQLLPKLFPRRWNDARQQWSVDGPPSMWEAYKVFDRKVRRIVDNRGTGLVTVQIDWRDPEEAREFANDLIRIANQRLKERAVVEAQRGLEYLNRELEKTTVVELRQAIYRLIEQHINTIMLTNVRDEYAFRVVDPAVVPDRDDPISPRPVIVVGCALLLGGLLFLFVVAIRSVRN